jgi:hypothetical protein
MESNDTGSDHFRLLPVDIAVSIFSLLPLEEQVVTIPKVSLKWKYMFFHPANRWQIKDLSSLGVSMIIILAKEAGPLLRSLNLKDCSWMTDFM